MTPAVPPAYVGGSINVPAGQVSNLLKLIQAQITPNCPGSAVELQIVADASNSGAVNFGAAGQISGPVSATNWAYQLTPTSPPRVYQSTFPGNQTALGELQVYAAAAAILHVEVQS